MSIVFSCDSCQQNYRVGDEMAGKRVRCKKCSAVMTVPSPAPVAAEAEPFAALAEPMPQPPAPPPFPAQMPLPPPTYPQQPAFGLNPPYPSQGMRRPKSSGNKTLLIVLLVAGLLLIGGVVAFFVLGSSTVFMSDEALKSKLIGSWKMTESPTPGFNITQNAAVVTFHDKRDFSVSISAGRNQSVTSGEWKLEHRLLSFLMPGRGSVPIGRITSVSDSRLVIETANGNEVYQRSK